MNSCQVSRFRFRLMGLVLFITFLFISPAHHWEDPDRSLLPKIQWVVLWRWSTGAHCSLHHLLPLFPRLEGENPWPARWGLPHQHPCSLAGPALRQAGEGAKKDNLTGVSQAGTILRDLLYHTALSSALGPTREDRALIPETEARPADVLIPKCSGRRDTHCNTFGPARLMLGD